MAGYRKNEARAWARENMKGVANVVIPSFSRDLRKLNEKGIRFDIRKEIEYGFWGTLLVSEVAITIPEYVQFTQWARDEAGSRLHLIHHAAFNTLEENIEAVQAAEKAGAELVLLSYPANFYAQTDKDIYDYTKAFCDGTNLGVILFTVPLWGFERLHPAGMSPELINQIVKTIPNIVAIKSEGGMPTPAGFIQCWKKHSHEVVVTFPVEAEGLPLASVLPMQFMGTSDSEYYGPMIPRIFRMITSGEYDEAMKLYWQIHPARMARKYVAGTYMQATHFINRHVWKYEGWLSGFNGGPLRQPTMKLLDRHMKILREGLQKSGLNPTPDPDSEYFVGRNPL
jgi:4-hydroxy-tetrahydrodipicolinate synthase